MRFEVTLVLGTMCTIAGCGAETGDRPATVPARGIVTYNGEPVEKAVITFTPKQEGGTSAYAKTDAKGRFVLQTFDADDGAVPGEYDVTVKKFLIVVPEKDEGDPGYVEPPPPKALVPEKYMNSNTSDLTAVVREGEENEFAFNLKDE